jgi:hypothetical protein
MKCFKEMDFFKEITSEPSVREYLKEFPEFDWKEVVKKTFLYGIHSLKALENLGLTSPKLEKIPTLHSELAAMKKNLSSREADSSSNLYEYRENRQKQESSKENSKIHSKPRGISQRNTRDKAKTCNSAAIRGTSKEPVKQPPFKMTGKKKPDLQRKLPKYLQNVDSKIKVEVQKFRRGLLIPYNKSEKKIEYEENPWEELKKPEIQPKRHRTQEKEQDSERSSSSFSTYNAAEDVKEFYQKEFSKLLPSNLKHKNKGLSDSRKHPKLFASSPSESDD